MSTRILVVPGGEFQIPAIVAAQRRGIEVVVADRNPDAPGLALADVAVVANPGDAAVLTALAREHRVDGITSLASDPCVIPCAVAAEALGLQGLPAGVAQRARNKMDSLIRIRDIAPSFCPRFSDVSSLDEAERAAEALGYPVVVKPRASNGSKGVRVARASGELEGALACANEFSGGLSIVVEEYLAGPEVSVETWSVKGEVQVVAVVDKLVTAPPYCVEVGHTTPSRLGAEAVTALSDAACAIVGALGIENGPAHNELILTAAGPKFVETGARLGGGCIATHLVPLSTGVDLVEASLDLALGLVPNLERRRDEAAAIRFFRPSPGVVAGVEGIEDARGLADVVEVRCRLTPGDEVLPMRNSDHRVGYVIARGATADEAARIADEALGLVSFLRGE